MPEESNTTFPHRPGYQAPEPEGYQPGRVIARAIAVEGTVVKQATAHIAHAKDVFIKHLSTMADQRHHYSTTGYEEQVKAFSETAAAKAVAVSVMQVGQRREEAQAKVTRIWALTPGSGHGICGYAASGSVAGVRVLS